MILLHCDLQDRNCYFEGHRSSSMLAEFLRVLEAKENASFKVIIGFEQFQPSFTSSFYFWCDK